MRQLILLSAVAVSACGSSVVVAEKASGTDSGAALKDGAGHHEGDAAAGFVVCGSKRCVEHSIDLGSSQIPGLPCCSDFAKSICGVVEVTCIPLGQEGRVDSACPGPIPTPIGSLPGCCRPDKTCGVYEAQIGFGCTTIFGNALGNCVY